MAEAAVCERLAELEEGMRRLAASFDASVLSAEDAGVALRRAAAIEAMAATVKVLAVARVAEGGAWKAAGERSPAWPTDDPVARAGELSAAQVAAVADAASADPGSEARLLAKARRSSLAELREECLRTKAAATDAEERRRRIRAERSLRTFTDAEGAWNLRVRDNPEVGAVVMAALEPIRDRLFKAARAEGRNEGSEAYGADALAELARGHGAPSARGRAKTIVRIDLEALLRGRPVEGEVCEIAGFGPVAVSAVQELLETGDPFLAAVVTRGEQVLGVAHLGRRPSATQQTALEWLYPTCAVEGCGAGTWLENDHRVDWAASRLTVLDLLDRLCSHHHDLKTMDNWALVKGEGTRPFVPPDDPRHPRHAHAPPEAAA
jgi:hypothetical protein